MGFAGRPASHASQPSRLSSMGRGFGKITATGRGGVRVHKRTKHHKTHSPRRSKIEMELVRDMMETNRAIRYAMIARATH